MSDLIKQLREIRREQKLSLDAICILGGVNSPQHLFQIERGEKSPTLRTLEKYARSLGYKLVLSPKEGEMTVIEVIRMGETFKDLDERYAYLLMQKKCFRKRSGDMAHLLNEIERVNFRRLRKEVRASRKETAQIRKECA
jgi:transcriptional regulator with XRE-family HTH domain